MVLEWQSAVDVAAVRAASPGGDGFDVLLGADVCYSQVRRLALQPRVMLGACLYATATSAAMCYSLVHCRVLQPRALSWAATSSTAVCYSNLN